MEEGYRKRGVKKVTAEARTWATVNKMTGGGKKSGAGHGAPLTNEADESAGRRLLLVRHRQNLLRQRKRPLLASAAGTSGEPELALR